MDSKLFPSSYTVFRRDRPYKGRKGGGVLIATRDTVKVFQREDLLRDSELLFVDILVSGNRKVNLGVFYRPPKSDINSLLDLQIALDSVLSTPNADLLLLGDFDMPEINWETNCASRSSDHINYSRQFPYRTSQGPDSKREHLGLSSCFFA